MLPPAYPRKTLNLSGVLPPAYGEANPSSGLPPAYGMYPELDLDFTNPNGGLSSLITFSRASSATYFDSTGTLQTASSGVARAHAFQDHDPSTLTPLGFLIEEQRTNSIRNNTMQGAVAGTPGTAPTNWFITAAGGNLTTVTIVGTGTESGIEYIDIRMITSGAINPLIQFEQNTQIAASATQTWTGSSFVRLVGGSLTNVSVRNRVEYRTAAGASVNTNDIVITPTSAGLGAQRTANSFLATGATIAAVTPSILLVVSGAADITLRIGLPQLEQGAFATSVIKTTAAAATRLADSASITGANFSSFFNSSAGTLLVHHRSIGTPSNVAMYQVRKDATDSDNVTIRYGSALGGTPGSVDMRVRSNSVTQVDSGGQVIALNTLYKTACAYAENDFALVTNGGAAQTDTLGSLPTGVAEMIIGGTGFCGHIPRASYYRGRLSTATMQGITV